MRRLNSKRTQIQRQEIDETDGNTDTFEENCRKKDKQEWSILPFPAQDQNTSILMSRLALPSTPYSAFSDPGPHQSPCLITPRSGSSLINFRFPHFQRPQDESPNQEKADDEFSVKKSLKGDSFSLPSTPLKVQGRIT